MKKSLLATFLLILIPITVVFGQITFQKIYASPLPSISGQVITCADGGYAHVASLDYGFERNFDFVLNKTDMNGDIEWTKTYGGLSGDYATTIEQLPDGGFIIGGHSSSFDALYYDIYIIRVDAMGEEVWSKMYGGEDLEQLHSIKVINKNEFVIAGFTLSFGEGRKDYFLSKINDDGDIIWSYTYGKNDIDDLYSMELTSDNGILLAGGSTDFNPEGSNVNLLKIDLEGDTLWTKAYHNETAVSIPFSAIETADGGLVIGAYAGEGYESEYYIIRTDAVGDTLWTKSYALVYCDDWCRSIRETPEGDFIMSGYAGCRDGSFLTKIDAMGEILWSKQYVGYTNNSRVEITQDDGYLFMSMDHREEDFGSNIRFIKTDEEGISGCEEYEIRATETTSRTSIMPGIVIINECPWVVSTPETDVLIPEFIDSTVCIACDSISAGFDFTSDYMEVDFEDESYAATTWTWDFGDGGTSEEQHPTYIYETAGTYDVCLEANNPICGTHTICHEVTVVLDETGIIEHNLNNISIYPNPTKNRLNIQTENKITINSLLIYSLTGEIVLQESMKASQNIILDVGHLANGVYIIELQTSEGNKVSKIIRQ